MLKRRILYALWLLFICFPTNLSAQVQWDNFELFTTRNGLPHNSILSVYQDKKGFLWIGTYNGLCRYDGNEFRVFREELYSKRRGWIYSVEYITEDTEGYLWISTRGGLLARMDPATGKWEVVSDIMESRQFFATCIFPEQRGKIWIGTRPGWLSSINKNTGQVNMHVKLPAIISLIADCPYDKNKLFVIAGETYLVDKQNFTVEPVATGKINRKEETLYNGRKFFMSISDGSARVYDPVTNKTTTVPSDIGSKGIVYSRSGLSVSGGFYNIIKQAIREYSAEGVLVNQIELTGNSKLLTGEPINCIVDDRSGIIWIGTNYGLVKVDKHRSQFRKYSSYSISRYINHNYVRALYSTGNVLWIGPKHGQIGCLTFDTASNTVKGRRWYNLYGMDHELLNYATINAIITSADGTVWAGGLEGLFCLKPGDNGFRYFNKMKDVSGKQVDLAEVWEIYEDNKGWLWLGTNNNGLFLLNPRTGELYPSVSNGSDGPASVWQIYERRDGSVWIGGMPGLYRADATKGHQQVELKRVDRPDNRPEGEHIWSLVEDKQGDLWLGTTDKGISKLNHETGRFTSYLEQDGLPDNAVCGLLPDNSGSLWIGTVNGLSYFDTKAGNFINFNEEDGLISNDFNFKACTGSSWNEMFWGTKMGITGFNPDEVSVPPRSDIPVVITSFRVMGEELFPGMVNGNTTKLEYDRNNLSFRFAVLDYSKPGSHRFRYKLEGFDNAWLHAGSGNPVAAYTNLAPGTYRFILYASPDGRIWSNQHAEMVIHIKAAFWQETWFWVVLIEVVVMVTGILVYRRIRTIIKRERELGLIHKQFAELEMKALQAQMNPHFIFNAVNSIQHFIIRKDTFAANDYLTRFARLMRMFLEASGHKYVLLEEEIQMLSLYISLEKLRFEEKFEYKLDVDPQLDTNRLEIPSMLLQPFVENAILHGLTHRESGGYLQVSFRLTAAGDAIECTVDDNGIGREKAREYRDAIAPGHASKGMKLVEERLKTLRMVDELEIKVEITDKYLDSGEPGGTKVIITIPLIHYEENESHYS